MERASRSPRFRRDLRCSDAGGRSLRPDYQQQIALARQIKQIFQTTPGVVDVDWYVEDPQVKYDLKVDLDKAALHGVSAADVTRTMQIGLGGADAGLLHVPESREDVPIWVRLGRADRSEHRALEQSAAAQRRRRPGLHWRADQPREDHDR